MNRVWQLCWKEWRVALDTPLGYVVAVAFLLAAGFFFGNTLFLVGQADMRGFFATLPLLLIFFVPAIAMRMLADELRAGTFELLATLPLTTRDVVLGKYLATVSHAGALVLLTLLYPLTLAMLGDPDGGQVAAGYLAALLLLCACSAIALYASALTSHAVVAYVVGFAILLGFYLLAQAVGTFSPMVQEVVVMFNPVSHYHNMLRGVVALDDLVFFVLLSVLFLVLTWFELERRRWR